MTITETRPRRGERLPPHNLDAEQSLLGSMLMSRDAIQHARTEVTADDFYRPAHQHTFEAIMRLVEDGTQVDAVTVADELRRMELLDDIGGPAFLIELQAVTPAISNARKYAAIIADCALRRRIIRAAGDLAEVGYDPDGEDPVGRTNDIVAALNERRGLDWTGYYTWQDFLNRPVSERGHELIDGCVRSDTRGMFIATEGFGKATFLRQVGMSASQAVHGMTLGPLARKLQVGYVDAETPIDAIEVQGRLVMRGLGPIIGDNNWDDSTYHMLNRPTGLDLRSRSGKDLVRAFCAHVRPDILIIGPVYECFPRHGNEPWENPPLDARRFINELRADYRCAVLLEAHAAGKEAGHGGNPLLPEASKEWMKWPDLGITFTVDKDDPNKAIVGRFRGDRMAMNWPDEMQRGTGLGHMPWRCFWRGGMPATKGPKAPILDPRAGRDDF